MIVDCDRCVVRGNACQDCVITVLLGAPPGGVELDGAERRALDTLAEVGMLPRLQLVARGKDHSSTQDHSSTESHRGTQDHSSNIQDHSGTQTGTGSGSYGHRGAERSAGSGERSARCVS